MKFTIIAMKNIHTECQHSNLLWTVNRTVNCILLQVETKRECEAINADSEAPRTVKFQSYKSGREIPARPAPKQKLISTEKLLLQ